jgi:hypothetical protein
MFVLCGDRICDLCNRRVLLPLRELGHLNNLRSLYRTKFFGDIESNPTQLGLKMNEQEMKISTLETTQRIFINIFVFFQVTF